MSIAQPQAHLGIALGQAPQQGPGAAAPLGPPQQLGGRQPAREPGGVYRQGRLGQGHRRRRGQAQPRRKGCPQQQQLAQGSQGQLDCELGAAQQGVVADSRCSSWRAPAPPMGRS